MQSSESLKESTCSFIALNYLLLSSFCLVLTPSEGCKFYIGLAFNCGTHQVSILSR